MVSGSMEVKIKTPEEYKKFRYKLLSIKNWLVISFVVLTFIVVLNNRVDFIPFITATDSIVLAAYFAVNHFQDKLREGKQIESQ